MTDTSQPYFTVSNEPPTEADPRYLAEYLRTWNLRLEFWRVPELPEEETGNNLTLEVLYYNGKGDRWSFVNLNGDTIYDLFDPNAAPTDESTLRYIASQIIENSEEGHLPPTEDWNPVGGSSVKFTDAELVLGAANYFEEPLAGLMREIAGMMHDLPVGTSYLDPRSRIAAKATAIAWEVL